MLYKTNQRILLSQTPGLLVIRREVSIVHFENGRGVMKLSQGEGASSLGSLDSIVFISSSAVTIARSIQHRVLSFDEG